MIGICNPRALNYRFLIQVHLYIIKDGEIKFLSKLKVQMLLLSPKNQCCKDIFWGNLQQTSGLTPPNPTRATTNAYNEYNNVSGSSNKKGC